MIDGIITFSGFRAEKISYEYKEIESKTKEATISPSFMLRMIRKDSQQGNDVEQQFNILLGVRVGYDDDEFTPFMGEVLLRGFFSFKAENISASIGDVNKFLLTNSCAVLFPYVRSALTDVTSKGEHNPIILPTINFYAFIEHSDMEEIFLDSSFYVEKD